MRQPAARPTSVARTMQLAHKSQRVAKFKCYSLLILFSHLLSLISDERDRPCPRPALARDPDSSARSSPPERRADGDAARSDARSYRAALRDRRATPQRPPAGDVDQDLAFLEHPR